ncbi:MAG: hypothetical protein J6D79_05925, partial [Clostridia bacterium]|nr:hypothetical protein [Clostridia bacterium]
MQFFVNEICIIPHEKAHDKTANGAYNVSNKGCRSKRLLQFYCCFLRNTVKVEIGGVSYILCKITSFCCEKI